MKEGDPFDSEERDDRRATQRRQLRLVPDWIVEEIASKHPSIVEQTEHLTLDHDLLEEWLRDVADQVRENIDPAVVAEAEAEVHRHLRLYLVDGTRLYTEASYEMSKWILDIGQAIERTEWRPSRDAIESLRKWAGFLIWADQVAADGYEDRRVSNPTEDQQQQ